MHAWRLRHHGNPLYEPYPPRVCALLGCARKCKGRGLCALHLNRMKSGIPLDYTPPKLARKRYRLVTRPAHPLADRRGRVYVHRMVLYDAVGGGRLPCYWCGAPLEWRGNLFVDHLNHDRHDNTPRNLVPACNGCNAGRTSKNSHVRQSVYQAA